MLTSNRISRIFTAAALVLLLAGFSSTASAQNNGKSEKFPVNFEFNPCEFELINTTGTANLVISSKQDANGCTRVNFHINYQNVTGVGATSGKSYRIISTSNQTIYNTIACEGCTVEVQIVSQWIIIGEDGKEYTGHTQIMLTFDICTWQFTVTDVNSFSNCD